MRGGVKPGIRPSHEGYSSSHSLNFYGGVKPYRRRKRKKTQAKPALKPTGGVLGLSRKKTKKIAGFRKALRLVPRKKRKARSYRYLKSLRPRTLLWRTARFSRLKTPLA
jgi:hypothetical protein